MKLISALLRVNKKRKTIRDFKEEILVQAGREQFKKLLERGLNVPIAPLK